MRPLLVGESNPYSHDPDDALSPRPLGAAGDRLRRHLELTERQYLATFDRVNLLQGARWSALAARERAVALEHPRRVLLGARVCAAHGVKFKPFTVHKSEQFDALILPHPSGLCRIWNDASSARRARRALRRFMRSFT